MTHDGPFTVCAVDSVCEFFGVKELSEVTEDMLVTARHARLNVQESTLVFPDTNFEMALSFEIGSMSQDELESRAGDLNVHFDKWTTSPALRSDVIERYSQQGEPHVKFEYAGGFWGDGNYSGPTDTVYVPESLIVTLGDEDRAFGKLLHTDPIHIVNVDRDGRYTKVGARFVDPDLYWRAASGRKSVNRDTRQIAHVLRVG
jgi:hypothetical protein